MNENPLGSRVVGRRRIAHGLADQRRAHHYSLPILHQGNFLEVYPYHHGERCLPFFTPVATVVTSILVCFPTTVRLPRAFRFYHLRYVYLVSMGESLGDQLLRQSVNQSIYPP